MKNKKATIGGIALFLILIIVAGIFLGWFKSASIIPTAVYSADTTLISELDTHNTYEINFNIDARAMNFEGYEFDWGISNRQSSNYNPNTLPLLPDDLKTAQYFPAEVGLSGVEIWEVNHASGERRCRLEPKLNVENAECKVVQATGSQGEVVSLSCKIKGEIEPTLPQYTTLPSGVVFSPCVNGWDRYEVGHIDGGVIKVDIYKEGIEPYIEVTPTYSDADYLIDEPDTTTDADGEVYQGIPQYTEDRNIIDRIIYGIINFFERLFGR